MSGKRSKWIRRITGPHAADLGEREYSRLVREAKRIWRRTRSEIAVHQFVLVVSATPGALEVGGSMPATYAAPTEEQVREAKERRRAAGKKRSSGIVASMLAAARAKRERKERSKGDAE